MLKTICANGDSFTDESYLDKASRWTNIIGATKNLSRGGVSNERIFNTTIRYLNANKPDILIIGWTDWERFMLPSSNGYNFGITPNHTFLENIKMSEDEAELSKEIGKFYYKNLHSSYTNFENMLNYMILIQNYCANASIKLLYFFSTVDSRWLNEFTVRELSTTKEQEDHLNNLIEKVNEKFWIYKKFYSMFEHCKNFEKDETLHPKKEGSAHWAKLVKNYL
jgi:hypothetical protein